MELEQIIREGLPNVAACELVITEPVRLAIEDQMIEAWRETKRTMGESMANDPKFLTMMAACAGIIWGMRANNGD